jgi:UDP-glucose 4-epimerase
LSVFNLGTGTGVSVLELVSAFEEATGVSIHKKVAPRRPGDGPVCYASTDKAKKELGWEAKKLEACADTWRWQKNNPNGYDE